MSLEELEDENARSLEPVDDPVVAEQHFSNGRVAIFAYKSTRSRKRADLASSHSEAKHPSLSRCWVISRDVCSDLLEVERRVG